MADEYAPLGAPVSAGEDHRPVPATGLQPPQATAAPTQGGMADAGSAPRGNAPVDAYDSAGIAAFLKGVRESWSPGMSSQDRQTARELLHDAGYDFGVPMVDDGSGTLVRDIHTPTINGDSNPVQDDATLSAIDRYLANEAAQPGGNAQRYAWANSPLNHLGANEVYRDAISQAAAEAGLPRSTIAAIIEAEAAKIPHSGGTWNPDSYNAKSHAGGLAQFLEKTWQGEAVKPGTGLNRLARERGYVDGQHVTDPAALLRLRNDPAASILAAAQYDQSALGQLAGYRDASGNPLVPETPDDDELARDLYLAHHEGAGGAAAMLGDRLDWGDAMRLWQSNVGPYYTMYPKLGTEHAAGPSYSAWLRQYIDRKIRPSDFR